MIVILKNRINEINVKNNKIKGQYKIKGWYKFKIKDKLGNLIKDYR